MDFRSYRTRNTSRRGRSRWCAGITSAWCLNGGKLLAQRAYSCLSVLHHARSNDLEVLQRRRRVGLRSREARVARITALLQLRDARGDVRQRSNRHRRALRRGRQVGLRFGEGVHRESTDERKDPPPPKKKTKKQTTDKDTQTDTYKRSATLI